MKDSLYSEDNNFYIDGLKLSGISSIDGSYNIGHQDNSFLGYAGDPDFVQNQPASASFSLRRAMVTSDKPITDLIGDTGFNGGLEYNGKFLNFESGFLNSYSVAFAVDQLAQSTIDFSVYGEMGPGATKTISLNQQSGFFIPSSSGISLNCDGRETNRVTNFSFTINPQRVPIYKIGSIQPCEVAYIRPVQSSFSVNLDVDDYETKNVYDYIKTGIHFKKIEVTLKDSCQEEKSIKYSFDKFHLVGESFSTNNENNTQVTLEYAMSSRNPPTIIYEKTEPV